MCEQRHPGPATTVATRVAGQVKDVITLPIGDDIEKFAERLVQLCRDYAGDAAKRSYVFTARDESGARVGVKSYTLRQAPRTRLTMLMDETVSQAKKVSQQFGGLGIEAVMNACKVQERTIVRLQTENRALRREVDELRAQLRSDPQAMQRFGSSKR
jgi:hypothetical protein